MFEILILVDYYLPGFKGGGAPRTIANMVEQLGEEFSFKVITRNHDLGEAHSYPNIQPDRWQAVGKAKVCYLSKPRTVYQQLKAACTGMLYLNSFFSFWFSIFPLLLHKFYFRRTSPIMLAPRGEFSLGALNIKSLKKRFFIFAAKISRIHRDITWHASSIYEAEDIKRIFGNNIKINIAFDLPSHSLASPAIFDNKTKKSSGSLKLVFLSRIAPVKNLKGALNMLFNLRGQIQFDIYGPIEDEFYWQECQKIIGMLPADVNVKYCGAIEYSQVLSTIQQYELFFFPTHGENFGHVILEALVAGCPVLLSDKTPWDHLENENIGASYSLSEPELFHAFLQKFIDMDSETHHIYSQKAHAYGLKHLHNTETLKQNRNLFIGATTLN